MPRIFNLIILTNNFNFLTQFFNSFSMMNYKKVFITFIALVAIVTMSNAQIWIGGGLGFGSEGGSWTRSGVTGNYPSTTQFSFSPKVGYYVSDAISVGLGFGLTTYSQTHTPVGATVEDKYSTTAWNLDLFARYTAFEAGNLSLLLQGGFGFGGKNGEDNLSDPTKFEKHDPISFFDINVIPVVQYSLSDRFSLEASFNFLGLGFSSEKSEDATNSANSTTRTEFGLNVNKNVGLLQIVPMFNVGLVFKL